MNLDKYKKTGNFTLSSGEKSNTYYDLKEAMGEPAVLSEMVEEIEKQNPHINTNIDIIIGIDYGGIPLAVALSLKKGIPYAVIRKESKTHGMWHRIEGCQKIGRVLLLDDVYTTGKSIGEAKEYLELKGYSIINTTVILDRNE